MDILNRADEVRGQLQKDLQQVGADPQAAENLRIKYLGKKGLITALFADFNSIPAEQKRQVGKVLNILKKDAEAQIQALNERLKEQVAQDESFDYSLPGLAPAVGHLHPITQTLNQVITIFREVGFSVEFGPEVETDYYNFEALNFAENHPARDMQDTFFIDEKRLLRTHTSPVQIRVMLKQKPPIRILAPGRVYRNEAINPRSHCVFHQVEGLYVDENVTFSELKTTLEMFAKRFFGSDVKTRFRPSFFPFTEPSAEMDISCFICAGKGCRLCKNTGWLEILGCGMVDPNVFVNVGIDPEKYTGYAFGMGIDRTALLKYGINDIRLYFEGDMRFLEQF
ncbi:MAG TPA: phenylalanine--tRNA ligase subunit alpha [Candidatus Marinimicrobia bacterium]|nr:phenylalanine--tRNA ligase subunit alpha [Candidatus Neomarinimicrobiota bacterium]HRS51159.1 phenylalanine--tRNA ligase subunit alpha [Candidatus Neomarinimicrobiota bacterium]HRU91602.1 phenylalanine--tRNA ligase subunit alpha [Candidatus Neomarinimicrobiota bacterium]